MGPDVSQVALTNDVGSFVFVFVSPSGPVSVNFMVVHVGALSGIVSWFVSGTF